MENLDFDGYITEKIFDFLTCGVVPIYVGTKSITNHIPAEVFIQYSNFASLNELNEYLRNMSLDELEMILIKEKISLMKEKLQILQEIKGQETYIGVDDLEAVTIAKEQTIGAEEEDLIATFDVRRSKVVLHSSNLA